jgi:hypothetical protein
MNKSIYKIKNKHKTLSKSKKSLKTKEFYRQKMIRAFKIRLKRPQRRIFLIK